MSPEAMSAGEASTVHIGSRGAITARSQASELKNSHTQDSAGGCAGTAGAVTRLRRLLIHSPQLPAAGICTRTGKMTDPAMRAAAQDLPWLLSDLSAQTFVRTGLVQRLPKGLSQARAAAVYKPGRQVLVRPVTGSDVQIPFVLGTLLAQDAHQHAWVQAQSGQPALRVPFAQLFAANEAGTWPSHPDRADFDSPDLDDTDTASSRSIWGVPVDSGSLGLRVFAASAVLRAAAHIEAMDLTQDTQMLSDDVLTPRPLCPQEHLLRAILQQLQMCFVDTQTAPACAQASSLLAGGPGTSFEISAAVAQFLACLRTLLALDIRLGLTRVGPLQAAHAVVLVTCWPAGAHFVVDLAWQQPLVPWHSMFGVPWHSMFGVPWHSIFGVPSHSSPKTSVGSIKDSHPTQRTLTQLCGQAPVLVPDARICLPVFAKAPDLFEVRALLAGRAAALSNQSTDSAADT